MKNQLRISPLAYQAALNLARAEGQAVGQVIEPFLAYATSQPSPESYLIYKVQAGDTLGTIARQFYGDGRKYPLLKKSNNLSGTGEIWADLILVIPPSEPATTIIDVAPPAQEADLSSQVAEVLALESEKARVEALAALVPHLPAALVKEIGVAAYEVGDVWEQSKLLAVLAPRLAELGEATAALKMVKEIKRGWSQVRALVRLAPYLSELEQTQALEIAQTIARPEDRAMALIGLIPYLPESLREDIIAEATATVELIEGRPLQAAAEAELAACLDELGYEPETRFAIGVSIAEPVFAPEQELQLERQEPPRLPGPRLEPANQSRPVELKGVKLLQKINPLWAVPVLILCFCGLMVFIGTMATGGVLLASRSLSPERIELPSNGQPTASRTSLVNGEFYSIVVSGRFNYNIDQPESWADAQSSYYQRTGEWIIAYWISIDGQKVIAQQADPAKHQYLFYVQGSDRPIEFRIEERREEEYANNRGSLEVAIYSGLLRLEEIQE